MAEPILEWIPSPKEWKVVEYSFPDTVERISNRYGALMTGSEVELTTSDLDYLQGFYDAGHAMVGTLADAIRRHGVIRVRIIQKVRNADED